MGKARRWLKSLLTGRKPAYGSPEGKQGKEKRRWGFGRSSRDPITIGKDRVFHKDNGVPDVDVTVGEVVYVKDGSTHAIAVAAASAAAADAAVAAAQAAEAVVRLTSSGRGCMVTDRRREWKAAIRIQTSFRGYLARRALRALRGLVRLQALVRGHIVRKKIAENLRLMQALIRTQARARAHRIVCNEPGLAASSLKHAHGTLGPSTPDKSEPRSRANKVKPDRVPSPVKRNVAKPNHPETEVDRNNSGRSWQDRWIDGRGGVAVPVNAIDDENPKILEIDPGKPVLVSKRNCSQRRSSRPAFSTSDCNSRSRSFNLIPASPSKDSTAAQLANRSPSSVEMPARSLDVVGNFRRNGHECALDTADSSPQFYSAWSSSRPGRHGPFSPLNSEYAQSLFGGYGCYCPSYMANTESWKAKARSQSAPKQRPELEKSGSARRVSGYGVADPRSSNLRSQRSALHNKFSSKAYPGSGRLDRMGMPVEGPVRSEACPRI